MQKISVYGNETRTFYELPVFEITCFDYEDETERQLLYCPSDSVSLVQSALAEMVTARDMAGFTSEEVLSEHSEPFLERVLQAVCTCQHRDPYPCVEMVLSAMQAPLDLYEEVESILCQLVEDG